MHTIIPPALQVGDTVGIIAPSWPVTAMREQFDRGVATLQDMGLKVKIGEHVFDDHYYSAGTRAARVHDFMTMWADPDVKMVLTAQGGNTANHLLDGLDYDFIRAHPKILVGISDGTTLLNAIYAKAGLVTYHGVDLMWTFGLEITAPYAANIRTTFFEGQIGQLHPNPHWQLHNNPSLANPGWQCLRAGRASGTLIGGHNGCLLTTILAGYAPDFTGAILFLEGTEDVAKLDRNFTALKLAGVFKNINGLILGWFDDSAIKESSARDRSVADMGMECLDEYDFPVMQIAEFGHNVENYVFPIGCHATIDTKKLFLTIDEPDVG